MIRVTGLRTVWVAAALVVAGIPAARAEDKPAPKPATTTPPAATLPAPTVVPEPLPMASSTYPTPGGYYMAYPGFGMLPPRALYGPSVSPLEYPYGGYYPATLGVRLANLPPRAAYGPSVSPLEYPYTRFVAGYPYPGYTMVYPYPRTVSSYSSGPSVYPRTGHVRGR